MHIPPKRRQRCLKVHHLNLQGLSQRQIGKRLQISHATVRSDLQLIETHWSDIAGPAADDQLLEQLHLLREQTVRIASVDLMETFGKHITVAEYIKASDARDAKVLAFLRESRRTIDAIHRRAAERDAQPDLYRDDAKTAPDPAETSPELAQTVHPNSASPQPEQEIVDSEPETEKIPAEPDLDALIDEAVQHFPHLKGQSPDQVLQFLDQITTPKPQENQTSPQIHAKAAA